MDWPGFCSQCGQKRRYNKKNYGKLAATVRLIAVLPRQLPNHSPPKWEGGANILKWLHKTPAAMAG
jgi:hypothetical protein